jgi:hypothetical protein
MSGGGAGGMGLPQGGMGMSQPPAAQGMPLTGGPSGAFPGGGAPTMPQGAPSLGSLTGGGMGLGMGDWSGMGNFSYQNILNMLGGMGGGLGYGGLPGGGMGDIGLNYSPFGTPGAMAPYDLTLPPQQQQSTQQTSSPTGSGTGYVTSQQSYNPSNVMGRQSWNQAVYVPYSGQHPQSSS